MRRTSLPTERMLDARQRGLLKLHDDLISQRKRAPDRSGARSGDR